MANLHPLFSPPRPNTSDGTGLTLNTSFDSQRSPFGKSSQSHRRIASTSGGDNSYIRAPPPTPASKTETLAASAYKSPLAATPLSTVTSHTILENKTLVTSPPVPQFQSLNFGSDETSPLSPGDQERKPSISARRHRKNVQSIDTVPRQTVLKALASSRSTETQGPALRGLLGSPENLPTGPMTSRNLSMALSELQAEQKSSSIAASTFASLASPCFFHQRFDDAVNIGKVLEEIQDDQWLSHNRLVQTATGVREVSRMLQRRPIKRAVRNVMIVTKARDNQLVYLTRELTEWLLTTPRYGSDVGVNVYVDAKLSASKRFNASGIVRKNPKFEKMLRYWTPDLCWSCPDQFDLVLTLGGDGTVLFTSWLFQRIVPPVLSFGLGSLGFLTPFEFEKYKQHLDRNMGEAGMRVNLRMRFTCTVYRADSPTTSPIEAEQFEVLNELVIDRGPSPYVSNLELYGDDDLLTVVQADGCIFSTPTGSTAYSLSAGGSLVHPDIPAILLTPICPHTLSFRPMLLNDTMLLRVAVPAHSRATAYCAFDGKNRVELRQGDWVEIAASQYPFPTVLSQQTEWFDSVSRTLRWNTRGATQKGWSSGGAAAAAAKKRFRDDTPVDGQSEADDGEERVEDESDDGEFDIDFGDPTEDPGKDSGYSAASSSVGPPSRKVSGAFM